MEAVVLNLHNQYSALISNTFQKKSERKKVNRNLIFLFLTKAESVAWILDKFGILYISHDINKEDKK